MSSYKIFPPVGVARVGNSEESFYIGPEQYRGLPKNPDGAPFTEHCFRDQNGKLRRQAALFHIFRIDADGSQTEISLKSPDVESITWTVHLANKKASWYEFIVNEGTQGYASNHPLRNPLAPDRSKLIIDAGPRQISGQNEGGVHFTAATAPAGYKGVNFPKPFVFPAAPSGKPPVQIETLGELKTDRKGRLLVLGGLGISGSTADDTTINSYANNDGWWDDTSDGPVGAVIRFTSGEEVVVEPARVLVAPPSYAPQIPNLVTLWDTIFDMAVRSGASPDIYRDALWQSGSNGYRPNFQTEIRPLLERAFLYAWVAAIPPKPHKFDLDKLGWLDERTGDGARQMHGMRQWIHDILRAPSHENEMISAQGATMMPYLAGDNCLQPGTLVSRYLRLTDTQYFFLTQWAEGWFRNEDEQSGPADRITRGVLENCVGGAFSPGIEMSWISRNRAIYTPHDPLRINDSFVVSGPLSLGFNPAQMQPGDVSRYMALPWQADFNECSSQRITVDGGTPANPRVVWWWPSQRPEFVYWRAPVIGQTHTKTVQVPWIGTGFDQLRNDYVQFRKDEGMVENWDKLGFIMEQKHDGEEPGYFEVARTLTRQPLRG